MQVESFYLWIPGEPVGKAERTAGKRRHLTSETRAYMQIVQEVWAYNGRPEGRSGSPIDFVLTAYYKRPKDHYRVGGELSVKGLREDIPLRKPDITNVVKLVEDALNGLAWKDDAHVFAQTNRKHWATPGHVDPGVALTVSFR